MKALTTNKILAAIAIFAAIVICASLLRPAQVVYGSVSQGSEYQGTTTTAVSFLSDIALPANQALGSVVITGTATGVINLYDATTSNINLRTGNTSSSSILLATLPASTAAGTYTFDRIVRYGLFVNVVGVMPTTTITFR